MEALRTEQVHMPHRDASPYEVSMVDRLIVGAVKGTVQQELVAAIRKRYATRELERWPKQTCAVGGSRSG